MQGLVHRVYDLNAFVLQTLSTGESDTDTFFFMNSSDVKKTKKKQQQRGKKKEKSFPNEIQFFRAQVMTGASLSRKKNEKASIVLRNEKKSVFDENIDDSRVG